MTITLGFVESNRVVNCECTDCHSSSVCCRTVTMRKVIKISLLMMKTRSAGLLVVELGVIFINVYINNSPPVW